jgi:integrase
VGIESTGWVFADIAGNPVHPMPSRMRSSGSSIDQASPRSAFTTSPHPRHAAHQSPGVPVKVVSERLGHRNPAFTIDTYQHVLPGMQAEAARVFEDLFANSR